MKWKRLILLLENIKFVSYDDKYSKYLNIDIGSETH